MGQLKEELIRKYQSIRDASIALTDTLSAEDQGMQSMPDASPTKWHLAHVTWFIETMVLRAFDHDYQPFREGFDFLFNSYYESLGARQPRPMRGLLSRPTLEDVHKYRAYVDSAVIQLVERLDNDNFDSMRDAVLLSLNHEQQHQELIVTDIVHAFSCNSLLPAYQRDWEDWVAKVGAKQIRWIKHPGQVAEIGHAGKGFAFDNEGPRHTVYVHPFAIADRLVTCGEYRDFVADGGYTRPEFWHSDGWAAVQQLGWAAPAYWLNNDGHPYRADDDLNGVQIFGRQGAQALRADRAVTNVSYYEAAAYSAWANARLPTEFEWEIVANMQDMEQVFDVAWQWTSSAYAPYPGFRPTAGIASEYNGKFMVGQQVLRGSSHATPEGHSSSTYRNFFPPAARWQFSGIRLARDL